MGNFDLEELHGIVERQIKVYGDAMDRIAIEAAKYGHPELVDFIQAIKINCGLGNRVSAKPTNEYKVRPYINNDDAEMMILEFLRKNSGRKFRARDIRINIEGRLSDQMWNKAKNTLLNQKLVKQMGQGTVKVYWVESR